MPTPIEALLTRGIQAGRFSDRIARLIVRGYAIRVGRAADRLRLITDGDSTLARETSLLTQALREWEDETQLTMRKEILRFARVEARFTKHQLERIREREIEKPVRRAIQTVRVTPEWADAVVNSSPSSLPPLPKAETHTLGRRDGKSLALPDKGQTLRSQYRRISNESVGTYNRVVQAGLLQGENPNTVARTLVGRVDFDRPALRISELAQAQGAMWRVAPAQLKTLTRTSFNQVQNQITSHSYAANQDIFPYYFYVAVLDNRTSVICASHDGKKYKHGEGPLPPLHFNCRSTTVPATEDQETPLPRRRAYRDEEGKTRLTMNQTYGSWLKTQKASVQDSALGSARGKLFRRATGQGENPQELLSKFLRQDGSEASLSELNRLDVFDID